jgi:hypothetical protein
MEAIVVGIILRVPPKTFLAHTIHSPDMAGLSIVQKKVAIRKVFLFLLVLRVYRTSLVSLQEFSRK